MAYGNFIRTLGGEKDCLYTDAQTSRRGGSVEAAEVGVLGLGQRLAEGGKAKMVIIGAAIRKLLHICFGVLKNGVPFAPSLPPRT